MTDILKDEIRIDFSHCDAKNRILPYKASEIIENFTTRFLHDNGLDNPNLDGKYQMVLVVLRGRTTYHKDIFLSDIIHMECSIVKKSSITFVLRTVLSRNEETCVESFVEIGAISVKERSITDLRGLMENAPVYPGFRPFSRLGSFDVAPSYTSVRQVESVDIDYNRHLNNVAYIRYAFRLFTYEEILKLHVSMVEIIYVHELYEGDEIEIRTDAGKKSFAFVRNGVICCKMKIE